LAGNIEITSMKNFKIVKTDRAISKPLMEKRRRDRINKSLNDLKAILIDALRRDQNSCSKLEKADILEMTVSYLQSIQTTVRSIQNFASGDNHPLLNSSTYYPITKSSSPSTSDDSSDCSSSTSELFRPW
jgi:hypothetical protein